MFHTARWKAYLKNLHDAGEETAAGDDDASAAKVIYHIYHSQKLWFTREEDNGHHKSARENLERCDTLLQQATTMNDDLQETLANLPKPSEVLDWARLW